MFTDADTLDKILVKSQKVTFGMKNIALNVSIFLNNLIYFTRLVTKLSLK